MDFANTGPQRMPSMLPVATSNWHVPGEMVKCCFWHLTGGRHLIVLMLILFLYACAGFPPKIMEVISGLMLERRFYVEDSGVSSSVRAQLSGISQGCTLSPLLFITLMSVLMHVAVSALSPHAAAAYANGDLADLAYADDTLLIGTSAKYVQEFLATVANAGARFGMEVHPAKFQLLQVRCNDKVCTEDGQQVSAVPSLDYLGSTLASDGSVAGELSRRIGIAKADFRTLCKVWRHSTLTRHERFSIFGALIESRLMYGLSTFFFARQNCAG